MRMIPPAKALIGILATGMLIAHARATVVFSQSCDTRRLEAAQIALGEAVIANNAEKALELLPKVQNVNFCYEKGGYVSILDTAIRNRNVDVVKGLVSAGARESAMY